MSDMMKRLQAIRAKQSPEERKERTIVGHPASKSKALHKAKESESKGYKSKQYKSWPKGV